MDQPSQKNQISYLNYMDPINTYVPSLTPEFCVSTVSLRGINFFRLSRNLDDNITQYLYSLLYQSKSDFDPSSLSKFRSQTIGSRTLPTNSCQNFKEKFLFPSWRTRDQVLEYCKTIATKIEMDENQPAIVREKGGSEINNRSDPYSGTSSNQTKSEILNAVLRQESQVELIVRSRTWTIMNEKCGSDSRSWEQSLHEWKKSREQERNSKSNE
ncbi:hypothetical protein GcM1_224013 [Golovinomyces cichoracearum]|uniref:Caffeine-induced death protein 2 n=1 Tax=Golovinomyces cichoracearum TaxID=62708 RepID=A0A420IQD8_9PEZI|nr:hypothetical protein GcM1_224013 [Golovinomyces cichoracearum]